MLYIVVLALAFVELILQITVLPVFSVATVFPNLILVTCVLLFVSLDFNFSFSFAFACGLVLDLFSRAPFGLITASLLLSLFIIRLFSEKYLSKHTFFSTLLLSLIATVVFSLFVNGVILLASALTLIDFSPVISDTVLRDVPLLALWSLLLTLLLWRPFQRLAPMVQYFQHRAKNL